MTDYRQEKRSGVPGRRRDDYRQYCPEHEMRIELANDRHEAAAKRDESICGKVETARKELGQRVDHLEGTLDKLRDIIVGRWTFWVVVSLIAASVSSMGIQQHWAFKEILSTLHQVEDRSIRGEEKIQSMTEALQILSNRQDTLRDQNLKLLDKVGNLNGGE